VLSTGGKWTGVCTTGFGLEWFCVAKTDNGGSYADVSPTVYTSFLMPDGAAVSDSGKRCIFDTAAGVQVVGNADIIYGPDDELLALACNWVSTNEGGGRNTGPLSTRATDDTGAVLLGSVLPILFGNCSAR